MREDPGKNYPGRRPAARVPAYAPTRQNRPNQPRRATAAGKTSAITRPEDSLPAASSTAALDNPSDRQPSLTQAPRPNAEGTGERIAKVMARAGLCSRREAEAWIGEGRVALNGVALTNPAVNVARGDKITIDGVPLAHRARTRLFLFHKPRGLVTTARDPQGRPAIFDYLRQHWPDGPRVVSIGRLDINSEGLLLLTNDGGLARVLELPATGWVRRYRVRAKGKTDQAILDRLREGPTLDGVKYGGIEATLDRAQGANSWLTMALREGKNREIKRVLEHIGLQVNRLIRLSFGPFQLGELAEGAVEEVRTRVLRDQLGPTLAKAAGADFSSPLLAENEAAEAVDVSNARQQKSSAGLGRDHGNAPDGTRRPHGGRSRGDDRQPEARPGVRVKPAPPARKHVSALRAESGEPPKQRKRIERRETADRGGRTVYVERLVSANREDKRRKNREDKRKPPDARNGHSFEAGRRGRDDSSGRRGAGAAAASSKPTRKFRTEDAFQKIRRERWQKSPRGQKKLASGPRKADPDRAQGLAKPYRKFEAGGGRCKRGSPERALQGRGQADKRSEGRRPPRPYENPGGGRPAGTPPSEGGPRGRGGPPKGRPRGKS
ncbi:MAG: pseudouridine synthase [Methylocella sp.]